MLNYISEDSAMQKASSPRLGFLRAVYLLLVVALRVDVLAGHTRPGSAEGGDARGGCVHAGSVVCAFGFGIAGPVASAAGAVPRNGVEGAVIAAVAVPAWRVGRMDAAMGELVFACSIAVVFPLAIRWGYVWREYVSRKGDSWWRRKLICGEGAMRPGVHSDGCGIAGWFGVSDFGG